MYKIFAKIYLFQTSKDVAATLKEGLFKIKDRSQTFQWLEMTGLKNQKLQKLIILTGKLEFMANFHLFEKIRSPSLKPRKHNENFRI